MEERPSPLPFSGDAMLTLSLLLLAVGPAAALDGDSLRAETTFGLFRDPYDFLLEPGVLAREDGHALYSLLAGQTGGGRGGLGYLGSFGPGAWGLAVDGTRTAATSAATSSVPTETSTQETTSETWQYDTRIGARGGIGYQFDKRLSLGAGIRVDLDRQRASMDASGATPGANSTTWVDGEATYKAIGERRDNDLDVQGVVGLAMGTRARWVEIDALVLHEADTATRDGRVEDILNGYVVEYSGYAVGPLIDNHVSNGGGLAVDSEIRLDDAWSLRAAARAETTFGSAHDLDSTTTTTATDGTVTSDSFVVDDSSVRDTLLDLLVAGHYRSDALLLRFGLEAGHAPSTWSYTAEHVVSTDTSTPIPWTHATTYDVTSLGLPVAVEVPVADRWTLRAGGAWSWYHAASTEEDTVETTVNSSESAVTGSSLVGAAGFRFAASERFRLDAAVHGSSACYGTTCDVEGGALGLASVYLSGVVDW